MSRAQTFGLALLCGAVLLTSPARADDVPNFRKKGDLEKKWVSQTCVAIIKAARTSAKNPSLDSYEFKEPRPGRTELHITGKFSGRVTSADYTADIVVHLDSRDKNSWEVLRIDYKDNSRNVVGPNRKNLDKLIKQFNGE